MTVCSAALRRSHRPPPRPPLSLLLLLPGRVVPPLVPPGAPSSWRGHRWRLAGTPRWARRCRRWSPPRYRRRCWTSRRAGRTPRCSCLRAGGAGTTHTAAVRQTRSRQERTSTRLCGGCRHAWPGQQPGSAAAPPHLPSCSPRCPSSTTPQAAMARTLSCPRPPNLAAPALPRCLPPSPQLSLTPPPTRVRLLHGHGLILLLGGDHALQGRGATRKKERKIYFLSYRGEAPHA
jgi:hypothetical protein